MFSNLRSPCSRCTATCPRCFICISRRLKSIVPSAAIFDSDFTSIKKVRISLYHGGLMGFKRKNLNRRATATASFSKCQCSFADFFPLLTGKLTPVVARPSFARAVGATRSKNLAPSITGWQTISDAMRVALLASKVSSFNNLSFTDCRFFKQSVLTT